MRVEQHVSVPRCGQLAVLTACRARGARFAVAQDAEGTILVPQRSGIRGMSVKGYALACPRCTDPEPVSANPRVGADLVGSRKAGFVLRDLQAI
jgi:hypothetical protein